jgi:hypothetical protein
MGVVGPSICVTVGKGSSTTNIVLVCPRVSGQVQVQVNSPLGAGVSGLAVTATTVRNGTNYTSGGPQLKTGPSGLALVPVFNGTWQVALDTNAVQALGDVPPAPQSTVVNHSTNLVTFNLVSLHNEFTLTVNASPVAGGSVHGGGQFAQGSLDSVGASANSGYTFKNWTSNGVAVSSTANYAVLLRGNLTLVANFTSNAPPAPTNFTYTVTALPAGGGIVTPGGSAPVGTSIKVMATTNTGYSFVNWTSNGTVVAATTNYSFNLNTNVALVANFAVMKQSGTTNYNYAVVVSPSGAGTATAGGAGVQGSHVTVTATNNPGYSFLNWSSNGVTVATTTNFSFNLSGNVTLQANFVLTQPVLAVYQGATALSNAQTAPVTFGNAAFSQAGPILTFTVSNLGFHALTLTNIAVSGGFSLVTNPADGITNLPWIIPGLSNSGPATNTFSVQMPTTTAGAVTGAVTIVNNDTNANPFTFPLSGFVAVKGVTLGGNTGGDGGNGNGQAGSSLYFGVVMTNETSTLNFTISNSGNVPLNVTNIVVTPSAFSVAWSNTAIGPNSVVSFPVTFAPHQPTNYNGVITVDSDATNGAQTIAVAGFGANTNTLLTVLVHGPGRVTPVLTRVPLKLGHHYTLTAIASNGYIFSNWTGSLNTSSNPLSFYMSNGTIFEATFVPNPFIGTRGRYNGLFAETNGVTEQTAGMLRNLVLNTRGAYSGSLVINGARRGFSGMFNLAGEATNHIYRPTQQGGPLELQLNLLTVSNQPTLLLGSVSGTHAGQPFVSPLMADLATVTTNHGRFTMTILPGTNNAASNDVPIGDGYALLANYHGTVAVTGALADGIPFSQVVPASVDQYIPLFANLYGGKGVAMGWVNLGTNESGPINWIHPTQSTGMFTNAFTNICPVNIGPWTNHPATNTLPTKLVVVQMSPSGAPQTNIFALSYENNYQIAGTNSSASLVGSLNPVNGRLTLMIGGADATISGHGTILLNSTNGGGFIPTNDLSGSIQLSQ